jgi:diaminopimelate decarboxylase
MHHFEERDGEMYCEDVPVRRVAEQVGTPFYLYSHATLTRHYRVYDEAFAGIDHLLCYAMKANDNLAILRPFANLGAGFDIVSGGELYRVLRAGGPLPRRVSGVGKTAAGIDDAPDADPLLQRRVDGGAARPRRPRLPQGVRAPMARVNPDVDPRTHPTSPRGSGKSKFGFPWSSAARLPDGERPWRNSRGDRPRLPHRIADLQTGPSPTP